MVEISTHNLYLCFHQDVFWYDSEDLPNVYIPSEFESGFESIRNPQEQFWIGNQLNSDRNRNNCYLLQSNLQITPSDRTILTVPFAFLPMWS